MMLRLMGLFAIIPATVFLTISFFILFTIRKIETGGLRVFGYVITALLWCCSLLAFSVGVYTLSTGRHPMISMLKHMQCGQMQGMMQGRMPEMMHGQK